MTRNAARSASAADQPSLQPAACSLQPCAAPCPATIRTQPASLCIRACATTCPVCSPTYPVGATHFPTSSLVILTTRQVCFCAIQQCTQLPACGHRFCFGCILPCRKRAVSATAHWPGLLGWDSPGLRTTDEPLWCRLGPKGMLRCGRQARPKLPISRPAAPFQHASDTPPTPLQHATPQASRARSMRAAAAHSIGCR